MPVKAIDIFAAEHFHCCENGHADKHADGAHKSTADHNGQNDPQRAQIYGIPQNFGAKEVAVKLLQDQNEDTHNDGQRRIDQKGDQDRGDGANEGAKVR